MTKAMFVAEVRKFLNTPFQHQGRNSITGVDCGGIVLCAAEALGLLDKNGVPLRATDHLDYGPQPLGKYVFDLCDQRFLRKTPGLSIDDGDILSLRNPNVPCHVGVACHIQGALAVIHMHSMLPGLRRRRIGRVVENIMDRNWMARIEGIFVIPGLA